MIRIALFFAAALASGGITLAQDKSSAVISPDFPPSEDLRKPDLTIVTGVSGPIAAIAYNVNGRILAAASSDKIIRLYDARPGEQCKGELLQSLAGHTGKILALGFNGADSNVLVSLAEDQTVKSWDVTSGKLLRSVKVKIDGEFGGAAFPVGKEPVVIVAEGAEIFHWNYETGELIRPPASVSARQISHIASRPDGKVIAIVGGMGGVSLWNAETNGFVGGLSDDEVRSAGLSASNAVAGMSDGRAKLWSLQDPAVAHELKAGRASIEGVVFSGKGEQLATLSDKTINVWDVETGTLLCTQSGHQGRVIAVAFSPNGQKMASADANGTINYWTVPLPPIPPRDLEKIKAALPDKATAKPKKPRRILVFWRADAILHKGGVPAANQAIELMGKKTGAFEADFTRDYDALDPRVLAQYDAIVMNSTAHLAIPDKAKRAYLDFVNNGGGVIGIHAAIDTFRDWPDGAKVIGATFGNHPWGPAGTWAVKLEEPNHPLLRAFAGKNFKIRDEFYEMGEPFTRADRRSLLSVDLSDADTAGVKGLRRPDRDFVLSWIKRSGKGRVFYCDFGHIGEPFQNPAVLQYYLDGIQYALGDLQVDDTPK